MCVCVCSLVPGSPLSQLFQFVRKLSEIIARGRAWYELVCVCVCVHLRVCMCVCVEITRRSGLVVSEKAIGVT